MNWDRLFKTLQANPALLADPATVDLLEGRLRQIEKTQDRLEQEALLCDDLLDRADRRRGYVLPPP